jgi:hypothetical protein
LVLQKGRVEYDGPSAEAVNRYLMTIGEDTGHIALFDPSAVCPFYVTEVSALDAEGRLSGKFDISEEIQIRIKYTVSQNVRSSNLAFLLSRNGTEIFCTFDTDEMSELLECRPAGSYEYRLLIPQRILKAGLYTVTLACGYVNKQTLQTYRDAIAFRVEETSEDTSERGYKEGRPGMLISPARWRCVEGKGNR